MKKGAGLLIVIGLCSGCARSNRNTASSSLSSAQTTVKGRDMSGTYSLGSIQCYNSTLNELTSSGGFTNNYSNVMTIAGNSFAGTMSDGACSMKYSGSVDFEPTQVPYIYIVTISNEKVISMTNNGSPSNGCVINVSYSDQDLPVTSLSLSFNAGQTIGKMIVSQTVYSGNTMGIPMNMTDSKGGACFEMLANQQ